MKLRRIDTTMHAAAFGAAALIASQVAGKATRDAFFLSQYSVTALPVMVIVASLLSIAAGLISAQLLSTRSSNRLLPRAFMASSGLLLIEWGISAWSPGLAALLIYLQMTIFGSVLISGFWSMLDDRFDARSARKQFGGIVAASTLGGIVGGLLAGHIGATMGVATMLPVLAFLHVVCAFIAANVGSRDKSPQRRPDHRPKRPTSSGLMILRSAPYVRNLALLILSSTMGAGLLDYVFKARVATAYPNGDELVSFFALFYTAIGFGTFLVQLILSRVAVEKLGIAGTVSSLPLSLAFGSLGGLILPGLPVAAVMRGGEAMVRSSLFKSGYEMLYAAVPRRERHATKSILDIGVDRMGDLLGAILLSAISWALSPNSTTIMLACAAGLGLAGFMISRRLRLGYVQALENSLMSRSLSVIQLSDWPTLGASALRTISNLGVAESAREMPVAPSAYSKPVERPALLDPIAQLTQDLRSANPDIVRNALHRDLDTTMASSVIALLAWDEVSPAAIEALKKMGPRITGQLVDGLLDPDQEFAIRRRIPRVLGEFESQRAVDGLLEGLRDGRFEVRFHSGQALEHLRNRNTQVTIDRESIIEIIQKELQVSPEVSRHYRVIDSTRQVPEGAITMDHVFRLLSLIHAREPLHIAHRALMSGDDRLRRTSLEYLENVLPSPVWQRILPLFEEGSSVATIA
jgi:ATP:ADP antiporter, AAA family